MAAQIAALRAPSRRTHHHVHQADRAARDQHQGFEIAHDRQKAGDAGMRGQRDQRHAVTGADAAEGLRQVTVAPEGEQ